MTQSPADELLARYLAGEATADERRAVEAWGASAPAHRAELDRLRAAWTPAPRPVGSWDVDQAWARVARRLDDPAAAPLVPRRRALAMAAAVVLALGAALVWRTVREAAPAARVVATAAGELRSFDLPDGTRITLAPGSRLQVAGDYGRGLRRVDLEGEAWFEVTHDAARPFQVHAAGTVTEDLGTEFAVRALPDGSPVRVAVVSGSASLRRADRPAAEAVTLLPRDVALLPPDATVATVERGVAVAPLVAWRDGRLEFDGQTLDTVARDLSRWYGLEFRLADPALAARRLTATVHLDRLEDALDVLRLSLGVRLERRGDTVLVR
jgi:transmembrane sensor